MAGFSEQPRNSEHTSRRRAGPPRIPSLSPELQKALEDRRQRQSVADQRQKRSIARGLIVLAVLALAASIARAGLGRVFVHGWWRQW